MTDSDWLENWFSMVRQESHLQVVPIPRCDSMEWSMQEGWLRHRSGRFFQVAGIRWQDTQQPLLVQREIGILGFLLNDHRLLVQAKVEPGNVGGAQMAPTCQATHSNLQQVHGGEVPPFAQPFTDGKSKRLSDALRSEQGSRFF